MSSDRIFFFCLFSFLVGIGWGLLFGEHLLFFVLLLSVLGIAFWTAFRVKIVLAGFLFLAFFSFGALRSSHEMQFWQEEKSNVSREFSGEVRIIKEPVRKDFFRSIELRQESCPKESCLSKSILWEAPLETKFSLGEKMSFSCSLKKAENFRPDFDYQMFLAKEGILWICPSGTGTYSMLPDTGKNFPSENLFLLKRNFEHALGKSFPEPEASLAQGLLLGGGNRLPDTLRDAFSQIGLSHIVAVSGYNITLVAELVLVLGILFGIWRKQALWVACLSILFFVLFVGAPASAVRAGLMAGVGFVALQSGRLGKPFSLLLLAAALMLFLNPLLLLYDIGFQLSFLATLGILFGAPWFERVFPGDFFGKKILEIAWLTGIIELFVVPLLLFHFQTFSWFSLFANVLLLPLVPFAMMFSFGAGLLFLLLPGAHFLFSVPAYFLLTIITRFAEFFGSFSWVSITLFRPSILFLFVWYAFLIGIFLFFEEKQTRKWYANAFSFPARR